MPRQPTCGHTTAQQLCLRCHRELADALHKLGGRAGRQGLILDLQDLVMRQTRTGRGLGRAHRADEQPLPVDLRAAAVMRRTRRTLRRYTGGFTGRGCAEAARWLAAGYGAPRTAAMHRRIVDLAADITDLVDLPPDRLYFGRCTATLDGGTRCGADLHGAADETHISCARCGATTPAAAARKALRYKVTTSLCTARIISDAALTVWGRRLSAKTIRTWANRGQISTHGHDPDTGAPLHRVSEVLDRARHGDTPRAGKPAGRCA